MQGLQFFLGVGAHEPFTHEHLRLAYLLQARGAQVALHVDPHGRHDWGYWSRIARAAV